MAPMKTVFTFSKRGGGLQADSEALSRCIPTQVLSLRPPLSNLLIPGNLFSLHNYFRPFNLKRSDPGDDNQAEGDQKCGFHPRGKR